MGNISEVISNKLAIAGLIVLIGSSLSICIYRLYFSPLASFPGDKIAAVTGWVETYHDVFRGGQLIFKLEEWHAKYGPVVRISPWEVHIADPDFVDTFYANTSKFDKKIEWKYRFGLPHSTFDTIEHHHHRARRSAVAPFFSKQKIGGITDYIASKCQRLCDRLESEYKQYDRPVTLNKCLTAFTFDIITYYAFARSFDYVERPNFDAPFSDAAKELATTLHTMGHFPWLLSILQSLPRSLSKAINPTMGHVFTFHDEIENQIRAIKSGVNESHKDLDHKTVFNELLDSDLPPEEITMERLRHEGMSPFSPFPLFRPRTRKLQLGASIVGGGVETIGSALVKACFFILDNPRIRAKLTAELESAFPDPRATPPLAALEALPYLDAVVSETLRITIGISGRTIRKSRDVPVPFKNRLIPAGAYFSMTTYHTHKDPAVWEAPLEFRPERWLGGEDGDSVLLAKTGQPLTKYLVPFGRGPRMCLGLNLAKAELFITLAVLFRRCNFELYETTREAVDMKADYFIPFPDPKIEGVQVLLK
ncbi:hypothetical protein M426DRAFT_264912 [Hypoxylon sp. CI-4A]|nr:hypothetical protein M426DRAFT_264912 [Hypoxylon sp. CI-4A]